MSEEELEKIHKRAGRYVETSGNAVRETIHPQIEGFKTGYRNYLSDLRSSSGIIAGAVVALLSSNIAKIEWLAILSLLFLIGVVILTFLPARKAIINSAPYTLYLKKLSRWLTDFSNNAVKFSRGEISPDDFEKTEKEFKENYEKWRSDQRGDEVNHREEKSLLQITKWYSEVNVIFFIFLVGLTLVTMSVVIPLFIKLPKNIHNKTENPFREQERFEASDHVFKKRELYFPKKRY